MSILRGHLGVIYNENFDRASSRFEFQAELLLQRRENIGTGISSGRGFGRTTRSSSVGERRSRSIWRVLQFDAEPPGKSGLIDDDAAERQSKSLGQFLH